LILMSLTNSHSLQAVLGVNLDRDRIMDDQGSIELDEKESKAAKRLLLPKLMVLLAVVTLLYAFYFKTYETQKTPANTENSALVEEEH